MSPLDKVGAAVIGFVILFTVCVVLIRVILKASIHLMTRKQP